MVHCRATKCHVNRQYVYWDEQIVISLTILNKGKKRRFLVQIICRFYLHAENSSFLLN